MLCPSLSLGSPLYVFNVSLICGYLPKNLIVSAISPIIKDKTGDASDKGNYRPIPLTSVLTKVLGIVILLKFSYYLTTSDHQFGFKRGFSTDICINAFKEIVSFYLQSSTPTFVSFLDASIYVRPLTRCATGRFLTNFLGEAYLF